MSSHPPEEMKSNEQSSYTHAIQDALVLLNQKLGSILHFEVFSKNFPALYKLHRENFKLSHQECLDQLHANIEEEIHILFEDEKILERLNELEKMITKNQNSEKHAIWRPSGEPKKDIVDHVYDTKKEYYDNLKEKLFTLQTENAKLQKELDQGRHDIESQVASLKSTSKDFNIT